MRIKLLVEDLYNAIEKAEKVLDKKAILIFLQSLKLTANGNKITLTANNLISEIHINLPGEIVETVSILINYDNFKLIKKLKGQIEITDQNNIVSIKANREFNFTQADPKSFPTDNDKEFNNKAFDIKATDFKSMLKIKVAAGNDDHRPIFKSICINNNSCWSCDGFRLMQYELNINNDCNKDIIIPISSINELDKIIDKKNTDKLEFSYNTITDCNTFNLEYLQVKSNDFTYITRLVEDEYINVRSVIPTEFNHSVTVQSNALKESLEFAHELTNEKQFPTVYTIENNSFIISRKTSQKSMNETIKAKIDSKTDLQIGFNIQYMLDAIKSLNADNLTIQFIQPTAPMIITSEDKQNELYMILPVRLPKEDDEENVA